MRYDGAMSERNANEAVALEGVANLLEWYLDSGVDAFVSEAPRDRFAETRAEEERRAGTAGVRPPPPPASGPAAPRVSREPGGPLGREPAPPGAFAPFAEAPDAPPAEIVRRPALIEGEAVSEARARAAEAGSLDELEAALRRFEGSNLRLSARSCVFGDGAADADLMLIGEAPGRDEDMAGRPFVGRSGQLLNRMLESIGVERDAVRVTNTVPWRPPGNRTPTPAETEIFLPFLHRHVELVAPKVVVCLGNAAAKSVFSTEEGILRLRGRWLDLSVGERTMPAMAMLHPAYLLRQPAQKKLAWRDLLALKSRLDTLG